MGEGIKALFGGRNIVQAVLALIFIAIGTGVIFVILLKPVDPDKKELINRVLDFAISIGTLIAYYYFGSSKSSADKNEMLKKRSNEQ